MRVLSRSSVPDVSASKGNMKLKTALRSGGGRFFTFTALGLVVCLSCPVMAQGQGPVRSLLEMRRENVTVQRWDVSCGAAALATVLTYQHGMPVDEKTVAEAMLERTDPLRVKFRGGFSLLDLKRYVEGMGLAASAYQSVGLEHLEEFGPAIIPVNFHGYPHFVVYRGQVGDQVLLADPAFGNRVVTVAEFENAWQQNIAFVVGRRDAQPIPNRLRVQESDLLRPTPAVVRNAVRQ